MGVVLDSTVLIRAERAGLNVLALSLHLRPALSGQTLFVSVISMSELAFGLARADTARRRQFRQSFIDDLGFLAEIVTVAPSIAIRAGFLRASLQQAGQSTDLADLLIAATALELGHAVATANVRHFRRIPGLRVMEL